MRVLVFENDSRTSSVAMEITTIGFYDDMRGSYGLNMTDMQDNYMYVLGCKKTECEKICKKIIKDGYVDLRAYGLYLFCAQEK